MLRQQRVTVLPFKSVNIRIDDATLRQTCRELLAAAPNLTVRALQTELKRRVGATGKTARLLKVWTEERSRQTSPPAIVARQNDVEGSEAELQERVRNAEQAATDMRTRAELAELREI